MKWVEHSYVSIVEPAGSNKGRRYSLSTWLSGVEKVKAQCYYVLYLDDNDELWAIEYNNPEDAAEAAAEIRQAVDEWKGKG